LNSAMSSQRASMPWSVAAGVQSSSVTPSTRMQPSSSESCSAMNRTTSSETPSRRPQLPRCERRGRARVSGCPGESAERCGTPAPWKKLVEPLDGMAGDAGQHIGEPGLRIDVVQLRRHDQRRNKCSPLGAPVRPGEQPCLTTKGQRPFILPMSVTSAWWSTAGARISASGCASSGSRTAFRTLWR
jgi:hypothetical protein